MWFEVAQERGVEIRYGTSAVAPDSRTRRGRVTGVARARRRTGFERADRAGAVVLGCGGFEANPEWRARYLGRPWDHAKVRGTRYNTGDGLRMALEIGALPHGQWTGCHSTPIDAEAPASRRPQADRQDQSPLVSVRRARQRPGRRFFDEGEDFQFYTYAKLGGIILNQPRGVAYQIFDEKVTEPARGALQDRQAGDGRLAGRAGREAAGRSRAPARRRSRRYNAAVAPGAFDPDRARRARDHGAGATEVELGAAPRHAAVHRVPGDRSASPSPSAA